MCKFASIIRNKISKNAGETIAETLVALLIAALALTMLAGAVMAGTNMIRKSRSSLKNYYGQAEGVAAFKVDASEPASERAKISSAKIKLARQEIEVNTAENDAFSRTPVVAFKEKDN